jgi:hypothetical protein
MDRRLGRNRFGFTALNSRWLCRALIVPLHLSVIVGLQLLASLFANLVVERRVRPSGDFRGSHSGWEVVRGWKIHEYAAKTRWTRRIRICLLSVTHREPSDAPNEPQRHAIEARSIPQVTIGELLPLR